MDVIFLNFSKENRLKNLLFFHKTEIKLQQFSGIMPIDYKIVSRKVGDCVTWYRKKETLILTMPNFC